jgi:predicted component of type VI protein secretion system
LVLLGARQRGKVVELQGESTFVGSGDECDIVLADRRVSRRHALISRIEGRTYLEDLRSTFGTTKNGTRCTARTELRNGDVIGFANVEARYEATGFQRSDPGTEQHDSQEVPTGSVPVQSGIERPVHSQVERPVHHQVQRAVHHEVDHRDAGTVHNVGRDRSHVVTLDQARSAAAALEALLGTSALPANLTTQVENDVRGLRRELEASKPDHSRVANTLARIISKVTEVGTVLGSSKEVVGALRVVAEWLGPIGAHLLSSLSRLGP